MARSALEATLDTVLKMLYPNEHIAEDMPIKLRGGKTLYVDRVIRGPKIAIEVDGRQHDEFVEHFHKDADGFKSHKERDAIKELWLGANGYVLVRLKHNEKITKDTLRKRILEALNA